MPEVIKADIGKVYRVNQMSYVPFGVLAEYKEEEFDNVEMYKDEDGKVSSRIRKTRYLTLINDHGKTAKKSSIYSSYGTSLDKVKQAVGSEIILITSYKDQSRANQWFSDIIPNRLYVATMYDDDGNTAKNEDGSTHYVHHDLLLTPEIVDSNRKGIAHTVRDLILQPRIETQQTAYWSARRAKYDFGDAEELLAIMKEEQANLKPAQKNKLKKANEDVKKHVQKWIDADKPLVLKIDDHFRQHLAMRYGKDTWGIGKIEIAVSMHADSNFVVGDVMLPNQEPFECIVGVMGDKGTWIATTPRPIKKTVMWYRVEEHKRKMDKNQKKPKQFWFDVYDYVSTKMSEVV